MIEYLAYISPIVVFWLTLIAANCACVALGLIIRRRLTLAPTGADQGALDAARGAIFFLAALVIGLSFSFASARYDTRRTLITQEANAIGTTYLRASYLPSGSADRFRAILRDYTAARLAAYTYALGSARGDAMERRSLAMQDDLWGIAVTAGRADLRNVQLGLLTQALNETIDLSATQETALRNHVPTSMLTLVLVVSLVSTVLLGAQFVQPYRAQIFLALIFALLYATVIATMVDLDRPQAGFVRINLTPLQTQLQEMR